MVDADLVAGQLEVLTATIPGTDPDAGEIVLIAHICHFTPSSNDDASGCGLLLELARTWQSLIRSGAISRPRRTIRFFWVPENYGTVAYLEAHPEVSRTVKAVIDLDMVGEDEDRCNSIFRLIRTPDSRASFLADVLEKFTEDVANLNVTSPSGTRSVFRYTIDEYVSGSDHVWFNDAGVGVPAVLLTHWPDNFYHTNEDSPDKVDPSELRRVGLIVLSSAQYLANAGPEEGEFLARFIASRGAQRIAAEMSSALGYLCPSVSQEQERAVRNRLTWLVSRETAAIISTSALSEERRTEIDGIAASFHSHQAAAVRDSLAPYSLRKSNDHQEQKEALRAVYKRRGRYLSALWKQNLANGKLSEEEAARAGRFLLALPYGEVSAAELFNLIDGGRALGEIAEIVEAERSDEYIFEEYFGDHSITSRSPFPTTQIDPSSLVEFMRLAEKAGLVSFEGIKKP
jgi:hypothetical protein